MADNKIDRELDKFVQNLRASREDAVQKLADSEKRIIDIQNALSDYEDRAKSGGISDGEVVEYTYKPGDTFGQVILDLGLNTDKGLWGADGDVAYYNEQLKNQGIWPNGQQGNIPVGTTIKLQRRGTGTGTGVDPREKEDIMRDLDKAQAEKEELTKVANETKEKYRDAREKAKKIKEQERREEEERNQKTKDALIQAIRAALKNRR